MEFEQIECLIKLVSSSNLTSMELEEGDLKLVLKKEKKVITASAAPVMQTVSAPVAAPASADEAPAIEFNTPDDVVTAPLVGTFYAAPSEDAKPYVSVGDTVKKGQLLGIIEAMKLMNEIECEYDGVVAAILVENEQVVEFGQPLFRISKQ